MGCASSHVPSKFLSSRARSTSGSSDASGSSSTSLLLGDTADATPRHVRTSTKAQHRLRCVERNLDCVDKRYPVKLVVFDLDETLTLSTFTRRDLNFAEEYQAFLISYNFMSPFVDGDRVAKLRRMLSRLRKGKPGLRRTLCLLSRNDGGLKAALGLLNMVRLAQYFSCIWMMSPATAETEGVPRAAYQDSQGQWVNFEAPIAQVNDHKADVLHHVAMNPYSWFPQLMTDDRRFDHIRDLRPEGIVLVDDQRINFQSTTGKKVFRYCKVARYDADYRECGFCKDMGGIGAHSDADYDALVRFVEDPWMCKETFKIRCNQRDFPEVHLKRPVRLIVFDFDETLTMATFMPEEPACKTQIGWKPQGSEDEEWTEEDLISYNFESPYVESCRVDKLKAALEDLRAGGEDGSLRRTLAVLTRNESGAIAVLNLLLIAGLADFFSVIWTLPWSSASPNGVFQEAGVWKAFDPPVDKVYEHKADILAAAVQTPSEWFPWLGESGNDGHYLRELTLDAAVLIDDERANFRSDGPEEARVLRYVKIARYDDHYRDCGVLNQMGGLAARDDADFALLRSFVEAPWMFPYDPGSMANKDARRTSTGWDRAGRRRPPRLSLSSTQDSISSGVSPLSTSDSNDSMAPTNLSARAWGRSHTNEELELGKTPRHRITLTETPETPSIESPSEQLISQDLRLSRAGTPPPRPKTPPRVRAAKPRKAAQGKMLLPIPSSSSLVSTPRTSLVSEPPRLARWLPCWSCLKDATMPARGRSSS